MIYLRNARIAYPVRDLTHACHLACELRDASEMDSAAWSAAGPWLVTDAQGNTLAHVSYNGRAWDRDLNASDWIRALSLCDAGLGYVTPTRRIAQAEKALESAKTPGRRNYARKLLAQAYAALEALDARTEDAPAFFI